MKKKWHTTVRWAKVPLGVALRGLSLGLAPLLGRQQTASPVVKASAKINPDKGTMGIYRSLAKLAYQANLNKDDQTAAVLGRILERCSDKDERDVRKRSLDSWSQIDHSMDGFIKPLTGYARNGRAEEAKERVACEAYLKPLAQAD
jgi:hypothetical protein